MKLLRFILIIALALVPLSDARAAGWLPLAKAAGSGYTGPGDIAAFTWWGGFRAYSAATAGTKAVRIVRASDSLQTDINSLANGSFDAATATTFCASTTCKVVTVYDKVSTNDVTQATDANRPTLTASALGTSYCMTFAAGSNLFLASSATFTATQPYFFSHITKQTNSSGDQGVFAIMNAAFTDGGTSSIQNGGVLFRTYAGIALDVTTTFNAWHAYQSLFSGAGSIGVVDGVETTGNAGTQNITTETINWGTNQGSQPFTGLSCEAGYIAGTISSGNRTSLNSNMHAAYGGF